ncbi:ABC transporter permease, partial [Streptococcus agalactiae]|nr:ABC transporter permease [Streptococcus agalactiae]MCK6356743.1 ABC transporter permease [Streptococcus agalactiae]
VLFIIYFFILQSLGYFIANRYSRK